MNISVYLPDDYLDSINILISLGFYRSRSHMIREAIIKQIGVEEINSELIKKIIKYKKNKNTNVYLK